MAAPSKFTKELADSICVELALGKSLRSVLKADGMPCMASVFNWLRVHPAFLEQYTRAKEEAADALTDEMLDIADDATNDWMQRQNSDGSTYEAVNQEHIQRSRLRIETRKWIAAKLKPKKYGDFHRTEFSGSIEHHHSNEMSEEALERIAAGGSAGAATKAPKPSKPAGVH